MMYHKTVLENGVRIISEQLDHLRSVSIGIWVNAGSRDEVRTENGVAHFIEHMNFRGSRNRSGLQIAKELDAIGGLSNAFTGKETTCFHSRVLGKHFEELADILADIFLNSIYDPADMERERQVVLQEISMTEDSPNDNIHDLFSQFFWLDHPIGMSILGTSETVSAIERKTILKYIEQHYLPEQILVVATGNIDHKSMLTFWGPLFESAPGAGRAKEKRRIPSCNPGVRVHYKDLEQVHICLGGEGASQGSEKRFAVAILNTILGGNMSSRLFQEIREIRGLAYSVYSFISSYIDTGLLGVYVATDPKNVNPALETVRTEVKKIIQEGVADSDLSAAKDHLIGGIYLSSDSADNQMMRIAKNEFIFERYISYEELAAGLAQVTVDQVVEAAGEVFKDDRIALTTLGPFKEEDLDNSNLLFS